MPSSKRVIENFIVLDDGREIPTRIAPDSGSDIVVIDGDDGSMVIAYAVVDMDGAYDWDWPEGVVWRDFRNQYHGGGELARDEFFSAEVEKDASRVFLVDVYSHGADHFSLSETRWYPDREWDVAPACVIVVPEDLPEDQCESFATDCLDEYNAVCAGDVWGIVRIEVDADGDVVQNDWDALWGIVGREYAETMVANGGEQ